MLVTSKERFLDLPYALKVSLSLLKYSWRYEGAESGIRRDSDILQSSRAVVLYFGITKSFRLSAKI